MKTKSRFNKKGPIIKTRPDKRKPTTDLHFIHHKYRLIMAKNVYSVIIFFHAATGRQPAKYRNVSNPDSLAYKARKWGGWYMNLYHKENGQFSHRIYV